MTNDTLQSPTLTRAIELAGLPKNLIYQPHMDGGIECWGLKSKYESNGWFVLEDEDAADLLSAHLRRWLCVGKKVVLSVGKTDNCWNLMVENEKGNCTYTAPTLLEALAQAVVAQEGE